MASGRRHDERPFGRRHTCRVSARRSVPACFTHAATQHATSLKGGIVCDRCVVYGGQEDVEPYTTDSSPRTPPHCAHLAPQLYALRARLYALRVINSNHCEPQTLRALTFISNSIQAKAQGTCSWQGAPPFFRHPPSAVCAEDRNAKTMTRASTIGVSHYRRRERLETHCAGLKRQAGNLWMLTPACQGTAGNNEDGHRSPA